jgi:hypothetical protein
VKPGIPVRRRILLLNIRTLQRASFSARKSPQGLNRLRVNPVLYQGTTFSRAIRIENTLTLKGVEKNRRGLFCPLKARTYLPIYHDLHESIGYGKLRAPG